MKLTHPTHFDSEDRGTMYLRNVLNKTQNRTDQRPMSWINVNSEQPWKAKSVNIFTLFIFTIPTTWTGRSQIQMNIEQSYKMTNFMWIYLKIKGELFYLGICDSI